MHLFHHVNFKIAAAVYLAKITRKNFANAQLGVVSNIKSHFSPFNVFFLGNNLVTWSSQKQKIVALSSCEAEYVAAAVAAYQGVWLSRLISEMLGRPQAKCKLFMDNQVAIALSKNPVHHDWSKHIDIKYHYIRDCVEKGQVEVDHIRTREQIADALTKALGRVVFVKMRQKLGMSEVGTKEQILRG